ncbi:uncharacterized protein CMU_020010 [Cryptosporidium muris RN66]|uniref:Uncharacterized protein n=1 Tax=Cryptosporidium muris (strain RN66) TaxID=441375 RepID=B6AJC0_CRYMR|nr:uncharacterized protein CMU_020010 [Cryptosporidium muris RN66]EEA08258.1 hypothetical protein, conserved [Cryptosporidium muris RN66]|eukprot:XP_002142607.1 hypothetical protein [Cryptosporidium muris RN66]
MNNEDTDPTLVSNQPIFRSHVNSLNISNNIKQAEKSTINIRQGISTFILEALFGKSVGETIKPGSTAELIYNIQRVVRFLCVLFSLLVILFIMASKISINNSNKRFLPAGSLGRNVKFDILMDEEEQKISKIGKIDINSNNQNNEDSIYNINDSNFIDNPEYWADNDDKDLWIDEDDDFYDMDIFSSDDEIIDFEDRIKQNIEIKEKEKNIDSNTISNINSQGILPVKRLRYKGIEVYIPSVLTLYGRVNDSGPQVNGNYHLQMVEKITKSNNKISKDSNNELTPLIHHGRSVYKKSGNNGEPDIFLLFDGKHEFWVLKTTLDEDIKPIAFFPDHSLIPVRHIGPYGAHSNSSWIFRDNNGVYKDKSVRIVEDTSINNNKKRVQITKATHKWHEGHNKNSSIFDNHKYEKQVHKTNKYFDPYT